MDHEAIKSLKKAELHCHLDGSLSRYCIENLLDRKVSDDEIKILGECDSLKTYLEKFDLPLSALQTSYGLQQAAYDIIKNVSKENVSYIEVRFAPLLSVNDNLSCKDVLNAVNKGLKRGEKEFGVKSGMIACVMRHHSIEASEKMIKEAEEFIGNGLLGFDLAGDEAAWPMKQFTSLFTHVKEMDIPFTIHAGECHSVDNVVEAVKCGAKRIGHGIALSKNPEAIKLCVDKGIIIEMCPTSNLQTKAVESEAYYPLREFIDSGLKVTINTDNRTVSNTTLTDEFAFIQKAYGITDDEITLLNNNALGGAL